MSKAFDCDSCENKNEDEDECKTPKNEDVSPRGGGEVSFAAHIGGFSTPKSIPSCNNLTTPNNRLQCPFEPTSAELLKRLEHPMVSPDMFAKYKPSDADDDEGGSSGFWTIEQKSLLNPVEIDTSSIYLQESSKKRAPEIERAAQKKIHSFFSNHMDIPSPHPQFEKKPLEPRLLFQSPAHQQHSKHKTPATRSKLAQQDEKPSATASTQTDYSIPPHVDLSEILREYLLPDFRNDSDNSGNSSMSRRRLFIGSEDGENEIPILSPPPNYTSSPTSYSFTNLKSPPHKTDYQPSRYGESPILGGSKRLQDLGTPPRQTKRVMSPIDEQNKVFGDSVLGTPKNLADRLASSVASFDVTNLGSPGLSPIGK